MIDGQLIICDLCKVDETMREPAAISIGILPGSGWLVETEEGYPDVHVCPHHADEERRRQLVDPWHWTCQGCQRTTRDQPAPGAWHIVTDPATSRTTRLCDACWHEANRD